MEFDYRLFRQKDTKRSSVLLLRLVYFFTEHTLTSIIHNLRLGVSDELSEDFHGVGRGPLLKLMSVKITESFFRLPH